ncbi:MAG: transcriptional repressor [Actinomycetia bacterium]|nr:transcriptional repressor [Actinomycetes bacterium]MCH9801451.1 transcriptional repressor [Actinomycetes bacterium]
MSTRRDTAARRAIAAELAEQQNFRTAQEIHADLKLKGASASLATVYRNLAAMAGTGDIDVVLKADGEALYRHCSQPHHHHLICRSCGKTIEVRSHHIENWLEEQAAEHNFYDTDHRVEMIGLCQICHETHSS